MKPKKYPKADLGSWSQIFFLSGLVVMLSISYFGLEWKSFDKGDITGDVLVVGDDLEDDIPIIDLLTPPPPPPPPPPSISQQVIEVVENDLEIEETVIESSETDQNQDIVEIEDIEEVVEEEEIVFIPFAVIEDVPIYPGCENGKNNDAKKKCMSDKVMEFVQRNFHTELAGELGLEGQQRISVQFKIDKTGSVVDVRARAPHPTLEKEAVKLIQGLPKMIPGKQRGKPVGVLYALPILFKVEDAN